MLSDVQEYEVLDGVPFTKFSGAGGVNIYCVNTFHEWKVFYNRLMKQKLVACDTETSGFRYYKGDRICGLSFGWKDEHYYVPVRHLESFLGGPPPPQLSMDDIREDLRKFFSQKDIFTIWHNWKFDAHFYLADGIEILTPFHDTRILWHLYDENAPGYLKVIASGWKDFLGKWHKGIVDKTARTSESRLDCWRKDEARARRREFTSMVKEYANKAATQPEFQSFNKRDLKKYIKENVLNTHPWANAAKEDVHYGYVPVGMMCEYAGLDTFLTWKVYEYVSKNLPMGKNLIKLYANELKLSRVLLDAEERGTYIDKTYLESLEIKYKNDIKEKELEVKKTLGNINLDSNPQLAESLLNLGVPLTKLTKAGQKCALCQSGNICIKHLSTDAKVLKTLAKKYDVAAQLLEYKALTKLQGTYVQGILEKLTDEDILHCSFNQNVKTGRMSSKDPNLQNIPGKDKSIRRAFVPPPGGEYAMLFVDYSQIEVRLTAHFSQDPLLLDAYATGQDVHTRTMCEMFGFSYDEVSEALKNEDHPRFAEWDLLRKISKIVNFGIIYGVGAPGLSSQIPRPEQYKDLEERRWVQVCQEYIDNYLDKYRGVRKFVRQTSRIIGRTCQVPNYFGRVRHLPHARACTVLKDKTLGWMEAKAKRQGVNFIVQGTAADVFKIATVRVHAFLKDKKSKIVNFVHDEVQIYLHKDEHHLIPEIKRLMEDFDFSVPLVADFEISSTNWAEKRGL